MGIRFGAGLAASEAHSGTHPVDRGSQMAESAVRVVISACRITVNAYCLMESTCRVAVKGDCHAATAAHASRTSAC